MKIFIVFGTRPEVIKLAPLILEAKRRTDVQVVVCNTGQHRDLVPTMLDLFGLREDIDLDVMTENQSLADIAGGVLARLPEHLCDTKPDWLVVQGDTSTAFAAALAAFYERIPVAHVEAGLRTWNFEAPWPEEMNRHLISKLASIHFAPTPAARDNLLCENIASGSVHVTGNTGIDALKYLLAKLESSTDFRERALTELSAAGVQAALLHKNRQLVLVTGHRRENIGEGFENICGAIRKIAEKFSDAQIIYPVHPNPNVRKTVQNQLGAAGNPNILLTDPLNYLPFVYLMSRATLILTDSGGVQEEAPSLAKRVIVLRETTERTEGLDSPYIRLAGSNVEKIVCASVDALSGQWEQPEKPSDLYGDGQASRRIMDALTTLNGNFI